MNLDLDSISKKAGAKEEGLWLLSFCDLSFILLSFFVLLLSQSKIDKSKVEQISEQVSESKQQSKSPTDPKNLVEISDELEKLVKKLKLDDKVTVDRDIDGVAIEFNEKLMFDSGSSDPNMAFSTVTKPVMAVIAKTPKKYTLTIEGHTDDRPIGNRKFRDNWQLSAERGLTLVNRLKGMGVAESRMQMMSLAHTKPKVNPEQLSGKPLELARAKNRRVDIRIH